MLGLRAADESLIFLAIVFFPGGELLVALAIAQAADEFGGGVLGSPVTKWIERDGVGQPGEGITFHRTGKYGGLAVQPAQISKEHEEQQKARAHGYIDLCAGKLHAGEVSRMPPSPQDYPSQLRRDMYERYIN